MRILTFLFLAWIAACGGQDVTEPSPSTAAYSCCVNGAYYGCDTETAFHQCAGVDLAACQAQCAPSDVACLGACVQMVAAWRPDPSACRREAGDDGMCKTTSVTPDGGVGATCPGASLGSCTIDSDCFGQEHCTWGKCYSFTNGNPCTIDSDCASGNCTDGCCQSGLAGSPCDVDSDCASRSCVNSVCN